MVVTVQNPDNAPQPGLSGITTGYQLQNILLYMAMTGYANVYAKNDVIKQGSVFELNGALIKVLDDEKIEGLFPAIDSPDPPNNRLKQFQEYYVMAIPLDDSTVKFRIKLRPMDSNTDDVKWSQLKGGWYREIPPGNFSNERALIAATVDSEGNLVGARLMNNIITNINPNPTGGTQFFSKSTRGIQSIFQQPGWVRFSITSGAGANAALGNGGNATVVRCGAGGGCGAGEETYLLVNNGSHKYSTGHIKPGNGGNAYENSNSNNHFYGMGGYGILEDRPVLYNRLALGSLSSMYETANSTGNSQEIMRDLLNLLRPIGDGENGANGVNGFSGGAMRGFGGIGLSANVLQFDFSTNQLVTITSAKEGFTNGGTPGLGWGGGGAGGYLSNMSNSNQGIGGGGIASATINLTGSFYHPGGLITVSVGGNGYNGGNGGQQMYIQSSSYSGGGGGGGAPGWFREAGSAAAGNCTLWYIGQ